MARKFLIAFLMLLGLAPGLHAQSLAEKILPLDGQFNADGTALELNWFDATPPRVGSVTVKRRLYGQEGGQTWKTMASGLGPVMRYTDDTVVPGVAYEYQVLRFARDIVDVGYWLAGTELPAQAQRGKLYLVVDDTIAADIAPRLARFENDLIADGWEVLRHPVPRASGSPTERLKAALELRIWLHGRYTEDPFSAHTVILVGHVPLLTSGRARPDGHEAVPHATDLFYADIDGRWSALREGALLENRIPGDFIEMQLGRIDFSPVSNGVHEAEIRLLRAYFDKNHHWRHGFIGDIREAYGNYAHLTVEVFGLRNVVGPPQLTVGGHHDVGEERPWLWGVDFGDFNGHGYADQYANKAIFTINFGSGKQKIEKPFNAMTALLAQPWYPLTVGWGARPAWWLHHMALGGSIGDVHMRTVNNGRAAEPYRDSMDYFPPGQYLMRNQIWVNLLGDPTLRAFPLRPATGVVAEPAAGELRLRWLPSPDPDVLGYRVFRATADETTYTAIDDGALVTDLTFSDPSPVEGARYMVRAFGLKDVYAGSFYTYAQGVEAAELAPAPAPDFSLSTPMDQSVRLPDVFNAPVEGAIYAIIEGPQTGRLTQEEAGWVYTPPAGFSGIVPVRVSVWDGYQTTESVLRITVGG